MTNRAIFLDRDGTMAKDVHYCHRPEDFELFPDTAKAINLWHERGFKVIIVTNQSGVARGYFTEETLARIHDKMKKELAKDGAFVDAIYYCPHHPDDNCDCRKPKPKMVLRATKEHNIDLSQSFVVGDLPIDIGLGRAVGAKTILIGDSLSTDDDSLIPDATVSNLWEAAQAILRW
ncbi:MAG: HAD family hydrolase [Dehalococcoidales bacterium]